MYRSPNRRCFLGVLAGGAAGLALPCAAFAQRPPMEGGDTPILATKLTGALTLFSGAGGNVIVVDGADGLVMINGGLSERSAELLKAVAAHTGGKPIRFLFNTDWHRIHTGSNETVGRSGATIVAHENTKQYLGAEIVVDWQSRTYKPLPATALPTRTFYTSGTLTLGAETIDYGHLGQAHTDAAIYVHFPASNVLVAGGAVSVGAYPIPDYTTGGWLGGLVAANKTLLGVAKADTRIVPGLGPLQTRADLQAQHDMLAALMDRFAKMMKQGMGPDDIIAAAPSKDFDATWGKPDAFVSAAYRSMWLHVRELGGIV